MIAGTILLKGRVGRFAGYGLRRGTLILDKEPKDLLPTFGDCGVLDFNWLRLLDRQLKATDGRFKVGYRAQAADGRHGRARQGRDADPGLKAKSLDVDAAALPYGLCLRA